MSEATLEAELQAKGLNHARLHPEHINAQIEKAEYEFFGTLTVCVITLKNGYHVIGDAACASPENFDMEIGCRLAYERAREKIWALEGYVLRNELSGRA